MKTKVLLFLMAAFLLSLVARLVHGPSPAQADNIPEKYRDTVHKGLEYLVKQQHKDGHWEGDDGKHPVAMTGLVGLALLMEKNHPSGREFRGEGGKAIYSAQIAKAVDWLMDQSEPNWMASFSEHASETARYMQGHGLATLFLAGVCRYEQDEMPEKADRRSHARSSTSSKPSRPREAGTALQSGGHDFAEITTTVIQVQHCRPPKTRGFPYRAASSTASRNT